MTYWSLRVTQQHISPSFDLLIHRLEKIYSLSHNLWFVVRGFVVVILSSPGDSCALFSQNNQGCFTENGTIVWYKSKDMRHFHEKNNPHSGAYTFTLTLLCHVFYIPVVHNVLYTCHKVPLGVEIYHVFWQPSPRPLLWCAIKSKGLCKKDVTVLLTHWSYVILELSHRSRLKWNVV